MGGAICRLDEGVELQLEEREVFTLCRRRAGLTQGDVARAAGLPRPYVSRWEAGKQELDVGVVTVMWATLGTAVAA